MEKQINKVKVRIMDEEYIISGEESDEYMLLLADYVDQKMNGIRKSNTYLNRSKVAVLAALNLADELTRLQEEYDELLQQMRALTEGEAEDLEEA